jgi:hypothetical protein
LEAVSTGCWLHRSANWSAVKFLIGGKVGTSPGHLYSTDEIMIKKKNKIIIIIKYTTALFIRTMIPPSIFVFDLDETLVFYDEECKVECEPKYYVRYFAADLLRLIEYIHPSNILILWTAATDPYVSDILFKTKLGSHFRHVLTWTQCRESMLEENGVVKSAKYLLRYLSANEPHLTTVGETFSRPDWHQYVCVLVDDKSSVNGMGSYHSEISVAPYDERAVLRELESGGGFVDQALLAVGRRILEPVMEAMFPDC